MKERNLKMSKIRTYGTKDILHYGKLNLVAWNDIKRLPVEYEETDEEYGLDVYSINVPGRETINVVIDPAHDTRN